VTLGIALALFFPSFFGDDGFNYMTKAEIDTTTSFWLHAKPGPVFLAEPGGAIADTWNYNLFPSSLIFGYARHLSTARVTYNIADQLAGRARAKTHGFKPSYVMVTNNMMAYNNAYNVTKPGNFDILLDSLQRSHSWTLVLNSAGVIVYELPPQQNSSGTIP
jgi:hypothetical protein